MKRIFAVMLFVCALAALPGCFGRPGPVEEYLKVGGGAGNESGPAAQTAGVVAIRQSRAADALDRQAVMLGQGRVFSASQRWYWEAAPGKLAAQAVAASLPGRTGLSVVWPTRSGTKADLWLTVQVVDFQVDTARMKLVCALECQVSDDAGKALAQRRFDREAPVSALTGQAIADAAGSALTGAVDSLGMWLAALRRCQQGTGECR